MFHFQVFTVAIGDSLDSEEAKDQLNAIAGDPKRVLTAEDWDSLNDIFVAELKSAICEDIGKSINRISTREDKQWVI